MTTTTSRSARYAKWLSIPLGLVLSALFIWQASNAAFTSTTDNSGNTWTAAEIKLTDDDEGQPLFTAGNIVPGKTETASVDVSYTGSVDTEIRFYGTGYESTNKLAEHIELTVHGRDHETGHASDIFKGTLAEFATTHTAFENGQQVPHVAADERVRSGTFTFTYKLKDSGPELNAVQGGHAKLNFVAQARSK